MKEDIVKAWRDPYFREVEARADAVTAHPAGEIGQLDLEKVVGGTEEDTAGIGTFFCCPNSYNTPTCPSPTTPAQGCMPPTEGGWCQTMNSFVSSCCCPDTNDPFYCF